MSISANVFHGRFNGFVSRLPTSRSTSGVALVSCSGRTTGPVTSAAETLAPDSGDACTHDSRNEWAGKIKSAITLVSSMKFPKLTMYGTCAIVSRIFDDLGDA